MKWSSLVGIAAVIPVVFVGLGALVLVQSPEPRLPTEDITIATYQNQLPALIYVAQDQGYFSANGLNVTIRYDDSGALSVDAVLAKEADIGLASEYVFARNIVNGQNITALGSVAKTQDIYLIGRRTAASGTRRILQARGSGFPCEQPRSIT